MQSSTPSSLQAQQWEANPRLRVEILPAVVTGVLLVGSAAWLFLCDPAFTRVFPPCPFHWLTGLNCPGCGSLRAMHSLLHGRVGEAFGLNPLLVLSIPLLAALLLRGSWAYKVWVPWMAFALLVAYGALRNIPVWPFVLLAPH